MCRPVTCRPEGVVSMSMSTTRCSKRTSPPSAMICSRKFSTTLTNLKVPMCGWAANKMSAGAPACTNSFMTLRPKWRGSLIWLYSLPSEKVPAPPSPNCTLLSGLSVCLRHKPQVSLVRWRTGLPRSMTIGLKPICAKLSAAKMPQGPKPTTTGRSPSFRPKLAGAWQGACHVMLGVA